MLHINVLLIQAFCLLRKSRGGNRVSCLCPYHMNKEGQKVHSGACCVAPNTRKNHHPHLYIVASRKGPIVSKAGILSQGTHLYCAKGKCVKRSNWLNTQPQYQSTMVQPSPLREKPTKIPPSLMPALDFATLRIHVLHIMRYRPRVPKSMEMYHIMKQFIFHGLPVIVLWIRGRVA